ncbi:unnamed protein product [Prunus armeniaca]
MEARTKQLVEAEREHLLSQLSHLIPNFDPSMLKPKTSPCQNQGLQQSPKNPMSDKASCSGAEVRSLHLEDDTARNGEQQEETKSGALDNQDEEKKEENKDEQKMEEKKDEGKKEEKKEKKDEGKKEDTNDEEKKEEKQDEEKHDEENVCDSIIGTLLEIPGKNKDGIAARLDLLNMGVKTDLQPEYGERRTRLPPGPWNLSRAEKREVCNSFYGMKVPEGYSSNIKNLVSLQDSRLLGLKSHDCHTLMQQLLPMAIRSVLEKPARYAITRLCFLFNAICAKTVDVSKLDKLEEDVVVTLCLLEKYFPPSFFDIMVHLVVHLVREVRLCGPVYFRWMYPFERYMKVLKGYVQNRTRPEGCIIERYIAEEAVEFCTEHLSDVSTVGVPSSQKMGVSKPLSGCTVSVVDRDLLNQAHLYVLENTEEALPYIKQHMIHIQTAYPKFRKRTKWLQDKHNSTFIQWLRFKIQSELNEEDNHGVSENLRWLAAGPNMAVPLYRSYLIKGIKFNIKAQDDVRTTQNSGVYLLAHTMQVASAKDKNPILSNMGFYGVIQEIWDLDYQKFTIPVFRCDWIDNTSGLVVDELGFTLVDLSKIGHRNDQFVLASQVKQVFFVDDPMHRGWSVVLSMPNREYNDVIGDDVLGDVRIECEPFTRGMPNVDTFDEVVVELGSQNIRDGCEDIWVE